MGRLRHGCGGTTNENDGVGGGDESAVRFLFPVNLMKSHNCAVEATQLSVLTLFHFTAATAMPSTSVVGSDSFLSIC